MTGNQEEFWLPGARRPTARALAGLALGACASCCVLLPSAAYPNARAPPCPDDLAIAFPKVPIILCHAGTMIAGFGNCIARTGAEPPLAATFPLVAGRGAPPPVNQLPPVIHPCD